MPVSMSHKAAFLTLWAVLCAILAAGCSSGGNPQKSGFHPAKNTTPVFVDGARGQDGDSTPQANSQTNAGNIDDPNWNDDFQDLTNRGAGSQRAASTSGGARWTIILRTYGDDLDGEMARNTLTKLKQIQPQLARAGMQVTSKGSMLIYGRYDGPADPRAQQDLARMKAMTINGRQPFRMAMLSRVRNSRARLRPNDLMTARRANPTIDPLYSLDVAMWSDFDTGNLSLEQIKRSAEQYAAKLRAQNFLAFFYHDEAAKISIVTVGLFNSKDIDPQAGLESAELTALRKRFPARLTNGEEVTELVNPRISSERRIQAPKLVLVPML